MTLHTLIQMLKEKEKEFGGDITVAHEHEPCGITFINCVYPGEEYPEYPTKDKMWAREPVIIIGKI
jgi:hypothetical protein